MLGLCRFLSWFRPEHVFTGGSVIMDSHFSWKQQFEVTNVLMLDLFQLLSSPDVNWWTVDYCDVFITLILTAPIHCRAHTADGMLHFSKSDEETNSSTFGWPWMEKFIFGWTTSFIFWHYLWDLVNETALFSGMRRVMSTTPLISSISCTLLRGKVSSTVGWMSWDTCSRYRLMLYHNNNSDPKLAIIVHLWFVSIYFISCN